MSLDEDVGPFDWRSLGTNLVIGVDEVGRGCLAGPVYAAAVILNPDENCDMYRDSKLINPRMRFQLAQEIRMKHKFCVAYASVQEIDKLNIFGASLLAMRRAVLGLKLRKSDCHVLVDGKFSIPGLPGYKQTPLIKGDLRAKPIAAASILAKVERDEVLKKMAKVFPQYGFAEHKAYATKAHREAIAKYGPCPEHRRHFAGVREFWK